MRGFKGLLGLGVSQRGGVLLFVLCATLLVGAAPASAALTFPFDGQLARAPSRRTAAPLRSRIRYRLV